MSEKTYCMGCMQELDPQTTICPDCHFSAGLDNKPTHIRPGTVICDRYLIGKAEATYNDSVIYIALDKVTEKTVTVYEFFPEKLASRDNDIIHVMPSAERQSLYNGCMQSFLGLWRGIKMFNDIKSLPCVTDILESNGTAYAIADHKDTVALKDYFAKTRKPLPASKAVSAFIPIVNALKLLHNAGIIHGNITPSTIQVGADGRLNLIGFSIPQCRSEIPELAAKPVSGFSPLEIYQSGTARAHSDIYSVMAVMYYSVTGLVLPRASCLFIAECISLTEREASTSPLPSSIIYFFTSLTSVVMMGMLQVKLSESFVGKPALFLLSDCLMKI
jgi:serine/threonine protein kinase